ncbi:MAG: hypothetical protein LBH05_06220 [Deferribacteraceae bacterium]|jgi:hypothetical protein|nr:hypothetical protein [Deferribacteraceae bacterium]
MRIFSASITGGKKNAEFKAVTIDKIRNRLVLESVQTLSHTEFFAWAKNGRTMLTCEYTDMIAYEAELPSVLNKKTTDLLIKNKIQNMLNPDTDYTFVLHNLVNTVNPATSYRTDSTSYYKRYAIYGVPSDYLNAYIGDRTRSKLSIATIDCFALAALSKQIDPEGFVCHAYADITHIILSFSVGDNLIYSRVADIYIKHTDLEDIDNSIFEIINLTMLYVKQTKQRPVNTVIFSGTLKGRISLEERVKNFCGQSVRHLNAQDYIKNCSDNIFQEYLLAIGCVLVKNNANFLPAEDMERNTYKAALVKINIILSLFLAVAIIFGAVKYAGYTKKREQLTVAAETLSGRLTALDEAVPDSDVLSYISSYINILAENEDTPVNLLVPLQELLMQARYSSVRFYRSTENSVTLQGTKTFKTYSSGWLFASEYSDYLKEFGIRGGISAEQSSVLKITDREFEIKTEIGTPEE